MKAFTVAAARSNVAPKQYIKRELHQFSKILYNQYDVLMVRGKGSRLTDSNGRDYVDMHGMYGALPFGHANEAFNPVYNDIMDGKLPMTHGAFSNESIEIAARGLSIHTAESIGGSPDDYQVYFNNTGAETVGAGDKFAKQHAYKVRGIADAEKISVAMTGNFHGRMVGTSLFDPSKILSREGFGPHTPNVEHIKWNDSESAKSFFKSNGKKAAYVIIEPIQGEGGIRVPEPEFVSTIVECCKKHGVPIIADEVQSGLRRTGADNFWASKLYAGVGFKPDIILSSKALGGGEYPVGAVIMKNEIADQITPGMHGSTFGGNARAMAFVVKTLEILDDSKVKENIQKRSVELDEKLQGMKEGNSDVIMEITGAGLWRGIKINPELSVNKITKKHIDNGVVTGESGSNVLRIAPSLTINSEDLQKGLERLAEGFHDISMDTKKFRHNEISKNNFR